MSSKNNLPELIERLINTYFEELQGERPVNVYNMVLHQVELPLLRAVMQYTDNNQTQAAKILGINRNTLRKKLLQYEIIDDE